MLNPPSEPDREQSEQVARRYRPDQERSSTSEEDIEAEVSQERYRALDLEVGDRAYIRPRTVRVFVT